MEQNLIGTTKLSMGGPVKFYMAQITKQVLMYTHHLVVDNNVNKQVVIVQYIRKYCYVT